MKSVAREYVIEFEERKSKFIGYVKPVGSKIEAEEFIQSIKISTQMLHITVLLIR